MPTPSSFDYAIVRVVPRVERGEFLNAGVILFCRTQRFLGATIELDVARLHALNPCCNIQQVQTHLSLIPRICEGDKTHPIGQLSQAERFHWLVTPRSTSIQVSTVHSGLCTTSPARALEHLVAQMVRTPTPQ